MASRTLKRFLHSWFFSLIILLILAALLFRIARDVTETYHKEPDFGGMMILRQADMNLDESAAESTRLTRSMILDYITREDVLVPIAKRCGWTVPYEEMVKGIDVKDRLSSQSSFIIVADTQNISRSNRLARELSKNYLDHYRQNWISRSKERLAACDVQLEKFRKELIELQNLRLRFQDKDDELRPLNSEIEMVALNEQLVEAQNQFLTAYGVYISRMEAKRAELQLEYDMACQVYTEDNLELKRMKLKLTELTRQCAENRKKFSEQKPDLYRMTMTPRKLENVPNDILYFYENVQTLQQLKLALMLGSLIKDKESQLDKEQQKKNTIERLLNSNSCDVFIREVTR